MARYLVTGGCGFIGSHLCSDLIKDGHEVVVFDDLSSGSLENLAYGAEIVIGDIGDAKKLERAIVGVDACFHLAAIASVQRGVQEWPLTHRVNLSGTIALLNAVRTKSVPVVYASSAAVYGSSTSLPLSEDENAKPISPYGADKFGCEINARVAGLLHNIPTLGLRFFNVFGPRQDPRSPYSGVISIFCDRLTRSEPLDVFGDGGQSRDFIYVKDVVATIKAGLAVASNAAPVLNVCSGRSTTVLDLAQVVAQLCDAPLSIRYHPARTGEVRHSLGDPARCAALLNIEATFDLKEGLAEVIAWMRSGRPGLAT